MLKLVLFFLSLDLKDMRMVILVILKWEDTYATEKNLHLVSLGDTNITLYSNVKTGWQFFRKLNVVLFYVVYKFLTLS